MTTTPAAERGGRPRAGTATAPRHPRAMVATSCALIGMIMGLTAGAIAVVPDLGRDLRASQSDVQWVTDAFPLLVAALLLPAGAFLDRHGRRRGMLIGLAVLIVALAGSAAAPSIEAVIASRALAGVGGALIFPGTLATITVALPPERRTTAIGFWAASTVVGGTVGLVVCAVGVELVGWRAPFWVFCGIAVLLLALTLATIPESRADEDVPADRVGAWASVVAVGGLVLAVTEGPVHGWLSATTVVPALIGAAMLVVFVRWELRVPHPLLDVRLFAEGRFGAATTALFVLFFAHFALFFLAFQYQGYVLGRTTLECTLGALPPLGAFACTPLGPVLAARLGRRRLMTGAMTISIVGASLAAGMAVAGTATYWTFAAGAFLVWLGMALAMSTPTEMIIEAVPPEKHGVASAVNDLARELAAAVGIAVAGSAFNTGYRASVDDHLDRVPGGLGRTVLESPGAALQALERRPDGAASVAVVHDGVLAGWSWSLALLAAVLVVGTVVVRARCPDRRSETRTLPVLEGS